MAMTTASFTFLFFFSLLSEQQVNGFSAPASWGTTRGNRMQLNLTPQQASELVQASKNLYEHDLPEEMYGDEEADYEIPISTAALSSQPVHPVVEKQRSFVSRAFSMPSSIWHPHAKVEGVTVKKNELKTEKSSNSKDKDEDQDVVYFPVVGFTFVKDAPGHSRPLPGITNPSCRLRSDDEVEYGFFHPVEDSPVESSDNNNGATPLP